MWKFLENINSYLQEHELIKAGGSDARYRFKKRSRIA